MEGESLINDASSLIVFKFALAAVISGQFVFREAVQDFFTMAIGGVAIGIACGIVFGKFLRLIPSNSNIDTVITIIVPYVMYVAAEHFHFSGVLAVVAGGLLMSYNSHCYLSHTSRIQTGNVWSVIIFLMNTFIFILIGLELPVVVEAMKEYTISEGIFLQHNHWRSDYFYKISLQLFTRFCTVVFIQKKEARRTKTRLERTFYH